MRVDRLAFELPEELVASRPPAERDGGRLMVLRGGPGPEDRRIVDLPELVPEGALLVANDTRVLPARLFGRKRTGGRVEIFLLERVEARRENAEVWRALARASKGIADGTSIPIDGSTGLGCTLLGKDEHGGTVEVLLETKEGVSISTEIESAGHVPLPPYVGRADDEADRERYQTLFARRAGAVAAPTAGLHLSERVLAGLRGKGVQIAFVTLHVSLGTFQPVKVDDLDDHPMHAEWFEVGQDAADSIAAARARGAPVYAVGTTAVRALESAADPSRPRHVLPTCERTRLLIQPGFEFRVVDGLLTNFHLPRSTLLALVTAFGGYEQVMGAYRAAIERKYRFFSYGDAMLIPPEARA